MIDFWRDDCFTHAAAISYFALMSLFPLLIIIISVLISLLGTAEEVNRHLVPFFKTFFPNTKVALSNAGRGALLTAILWEAAKHLFTWYMGNVAHYKSLYGSLTTIVVFLSWIYYSASILLYGAEVVYQLGSQKRHVTLRKQAVRR